MTRCVSTPHPTNRSRIIRAFPGRIRRGYKQSNLIWDRPARRITLKAARNETVAFQIVIERTGETLSNVMVAPPELKGPNGAKISLENVDLFREWHVHVRNPTKESYTLGGGWDADGSLPCMHWTGNLYPHTYVMPFDVSDPLKNVGARRCGWMSTSRTRAKLRGWAGTLRQSRLRVNHYDVPALGGILTCQLMLRRTTDARRTAQRLQQMLEDRDPAFFRPLRSWPNTAILLAQNQ